MTYPSLPAFLLLFFLSTQGTFAAIFQVTDTLPGQTTRDSLLVQEVSVDTTLVVELTERGIVRDSLINDSVVLKPVDLDMERMELLLVDTIVVEKEKINYWTKSNVAGINLNEVAFINWNTGGNNSISALTHATFRRRYQKALLNWNSRMEVRYGLNAQQGRELRKSEDRFEIESTLGYRADSTSNWFYSAQVNFNTQLTYGYRYPDTDNPISKLMAPGYAFIGVGTEFSHPTEDFTFYLSPVTQKSTFVLDQDLANEGSFGVTPAVRDEEGNIIKEGEKIRSEFGFLFSSNLTREIFDNVTMENRVRLYSDYLNNFGNIDIDWEIKFDMRVNQYVNANIGFHLKYDDDVKFKEDRNGDGVLETVGPKVQFKQILGVGLVYNF